MGKYPPKHPLVDRPYRRYLTGYMGLISDAFGTMVANRVYLIPLEVEYALGVTVDRVLLIYDTPVAGNVRAGIYEDNGETPVGGALMVDSGSVAKTGTYQKQEVTIAETFLPRGLHWLAVQSDEATTKYCRNILGVAGTLRTYQYDPVGYAFTDPCPAVAASNNLPVLGVRVAHIP